MPVRTSRRRVERRRPGPDGALVGNTVADDLAIEEPLEIHVAGAPVAVTMRTPGEDTDLVLGWLVGEGVISSADDVLAVAERSGGEGLEHAASVHVTLRPGLSGPAPRAYVTTSACGVCGADAVAAVRGRLAWAAPADLVVDAQLVAALPEALRAAQRAFARTGGLHAAGIFDATGAPRVVREDVGRHNAIDKVVGHALRQGWLPLQDSIIQVSGRASFELVQKCAAAGAPLLSAVSAPSSLAVDLADATGVTLLAFVRDGGLNVYTHGERLR